MRIETDCISVYIDHKRRLIITETITTEVGNIKETKTKRFKGHEYLKHKEYR